MKNNWDSLPLYKRSIFSKLASLQPLLSDIPYIGSRKVKAFLKDHLIPASQVEFLGALSKSSRIYLVKKEMYVYKALSGNKIANLVIPEGALIRIPCSYSNKFRASRAKVHSIYSLRGKRYCDKGISEFDTNFKYNVGNIVVPTYPFSLGDSECAPGIHFFLNIADAINYLR